MDFITSRLFQQKLISAWVHILQRERNWFWATHHVEVQSVDADAGVILDTQIDVFLDTKAEVSGI